MSISNPATRSLIEVRNLVKRYDGRLVLDGFELTVGSGETCVIIGGSGSGKTTFLVLSTGTADMIEHARAVLGTSGASYLNAQTTWT